MNQNYPEYILKKLRCFSGLEEEDTSLDKTFQELEPEEVFDRVMKFDGIIGYRYTMLRWIQDIFKVKLDPHGEAQSRPDFVQGLGNIFRAQDRMDEVVAMRMDENDIVHVLFEGGGMHTANCAMDSKRAIIFDVITQAF